MSAAPLARSTERDADRPLGDRLVEAGLDILTEGGLEAITLRAIARRAGVSHGAPLRHFKSLADLLAEVSAHGFRMLRDRLATAADSLPAGAGAMARLRAAGTAYVEAAVEHPALFGLMFRPDTIDVENARYRTDADAAFDRLLSLVLAAQDSGWHAQRDSRLLAGAVWAQVHGIATLWSSGALLGPVPDARLAEAIELTFDLAFVERTP